MQIGICTKDQVLDSHLDEEGYSLHRNGALNGFNRTIKTSIYCEKRVPYGAGDEITMILDLYEYKLSIEKNGVLTPLSFTDLPRKKYYLATALGLDSVIEITNCECIPKQYNTIKLISVYFDFSLSLHACEHFFVCLWY